MKKDILLSIAQFEDLYGEWDEFKIKMITDSSVSVYSRDEKERYSTSESKEILTDFKGVLKKNNLMISSRKHHSVEIKAYIYEFEAEYESLADDIERVLAAKITNLKIYTKDGRPMIRFEYAVNLTSGEKNKVKKIVEELVDKNLNK
jgi:hypothetical protein